MNIEVHAEKEVWSNRVSLWFTQLVPNENGKLTRRYGTTVEYTVAVDTGVCDPPATVRMMPSSAQSLMDELWRIGFRPTEGSGSAGSLAATERHLADMRRLVFDPMTTRIVLDKETP